MHTEPACKAGRSSKRVSQTHIVSEALSNEHAKKARKRERKRGTKRWISSRRAHSTHSSVVINRSILIYMARSQFAVLNMLVLYFSPKHVEWEIFLNIFLQFIDKETVERVQSAWSILRSSSLLLGRMSLAFSPASGFDYFSCLTLEKPETDSHQITFLHD